MFRAGVVIGVNYDREHKDQEEVKAFLHCSMGSIGSYFVQGWVGKLQVAADPTLCDFQGEI